MSSRFSIMALACGALAIIAGCSVGPDYRRPAALKSEAVPEAYSVQTGTNNFGEWKTAEPAANLPRGAWWEIFDDTQLSKLETARRLGEPGAGGGGGAVGTIAR